tara:strand:- start:1061 stop:1231 length:171 start_codon:yes stop_codon:yes gene_type:complete
MKLAEIKETLEALLWFLIISCFLYGLDLMSKCSSLVNLLMSKFKQSKGKESKGNKR